MKNINRIICFVLVLCFIFSLSSCDDGNEIIDSDSVQPEIDLDGNESIESDSVQSEIDLDGNEIIESDSVQPEIDLNGYENIECKTTKGTEMRYFSFDDSDASALSVAFPIEWTIREGDVGYDVFRDNEKIGTIKPGKANVLPDETVCQSEKYIKDDVTFEWSIILNGGEFIHRIVYGCKIGENNRSMTLEVGYAELDKISLRRAKLLISVKKIKTDPGLGAIDLSARPGEKPILIVGNSFVGSSRVGAIFARMCQASRKNRYEVVWKSQGMATVSNNWSEYKDEMREGKYAAVFMCGFYGSGDVAAFKSFVDLCKASNTPIVIFPAHNEKNGANAANSYPDAYYLNWKGELDTLISNGVSRWDLCVDDYYDHSLPLAGYVGAHMIYRALFGEMPPILNEYDNGLYHRTVTQKLGDYAQTGCLPSIDGNVRIYKMN